MGRPDWVKALLKQAEIMGIPVERTRSDHWKLRFPQGNAMIPNSPGDIRTQQNCMRDLRKLGWDDLKEEYNRKAETARAERLARGMQGAVAPHEFQPEPEPESETSEVTPPKETESNLGWIEVDGQKIAIAEIAVPVRHQHWRSPEPRVLDAAEELLLIDGSVRYRCRRGTGAWTGSGPVLCDRHFETPGGLIVHWARGVHAEPEAPIPTEPEPKVVKVEATLVPQGTVVGLVLQAERLRKLEECLEDAAGLAGSIAGSLEVLIEKLPDELVSDELRAKAQKFDAMIAAANQ